MPYPLIETLRDQYIESDKWYSLQWHYTEACILKAYLDYYELTGERKYYDFVKRYIDSLFNEEGAIPQIDYNYYNIDQLKMGSILLALYKHEKDSRYKQIMDRLYEQLSSYPRTKSGSFWHKTNYPNQIWLDGLYMAQPFYVQYTKEFVQYKDYSDSIRQLCDVKKYLYNESERLFYHAYDESRQIFWSDPDTGLSPCVWGRAVGWYAMALVDVLELLQGEQVDLIPLQSILQEVVDGMIPHQHESGMWYQVVNATSRADNYLESSGTLMMSYSILKAVRQALLPRQYATYGVQAFEGTLDQYLTIEDGEIQLGGICKSAGVGTNPETGVIRDGTYHYYVYREEVVVNNGHGVAPLLMACNEMIQKGRS